MRTGLWSLQGVRYLQPGFHSGYIPSKKDALWACIEHFKMASLPLKVHQNIFITQTAKYLIISLYISSDGSFAKWNL